MKTDNQKMRDLLSAWMDNTRGKLPLTWGGRRCWVKKQPYSQGWWSQYEGERCIGIRVSVGSEFYDGPMADMNLIITDSGRYFVYEKEHPGGLVELTNMVAKIFLANIPKAIPEHPPLKLNEFYFIVPRDDAPLHIAIKPVDVCLVTELPWDGNDMQYRLRVTGSDFDHDISDWPPHRFRFVKVATPKSVKERML